MQIATRRSELQSINLDQLLRREDVQNLHPLPEMAAATKISYRLNIPVGVQLANYGAISRDPVLRHTIPPTVPEAILCPCQRWKGPNCSYDDGHIIFTDPTVIKNTLLRSLWSKSRKYRCQYRLGGVLPAIEEGIDEYIGRCYDSNADFSEWKASLMSSVKARIEQCMPSASETPSLETCIAAQKELEEIHRSMVVTYTDKSQHDMVAGCKARYIRRLWEELHSGVYTTTALTASQVAVNHDAKARLLGRVGNTGFYDDVHQFKPRKSC